MPTPTVLFLGTHAPLLQMLRTEVGARFSITHVLPSSPTPIIPDLENVIMVVVQHDSSQQDVLPSMRQFRRDAPDIPIIVFTSDFSGSNTRTFLKTGAMDVYPVEANPGDMLACLEAYLPGYKWALPKGQKKRVGQKSTLLLATAATSVMAAVPGLAGMPIRELSVAGHRMEQPESYIGGLDLKFLGFFSITINGKQVELAKQAKLLFAYMAYHYPRAFSRDHLARVFWPEKHENQPESARRSLNVELGTIRKSLRAQVGLERDFIVFEKNNYRLVMDFDMHSDVVYFKQLCQKIHELRRAGQLIPDDMYQSVIQAYQGEFLEDCPQEAINWVEVERQHLSAVFEQVAEQYSAQLFLEGDYWKATAVCHEILSHDPNIEVIHRRLMLCYAHLGMCNKMEAQFKLLCQILKTRFQSKPSAETIRVYEALKQEQCA
jgi:DNA-binding SARP family transcriptional activator